MVQKVWMNPYRMFCPQELKGANRPCGLYYVNWMLNFIYKYDIQALDRVFFFDKVWFHISGYINAQNYHTWSMTKPHVYHKSLLHPLKISMWYALSRDKIIGPMFFNKTVNSVEYQRTITDFIVNLLVEERYCYLQQDSTWANTSEETVSFSREFFDDRLTSLSVWSPCLLDLKPSDVFLWGYLKDRVFVRIYASFVQNLHKSYAKFIQDWHKFLFKMYTILFIQNLYKTGTTSYINLYKIYEIFFFNFTQNLYKIYTDFVRFYSKFTQNKFP